MNPLQLIYLLASCFYFSLASTRVVLMLFALHLGAKPLEVGGILALYYVFPGLLSWSVGRFADRAGARWPLLLAAGCGILGMLLAFLLPRLPVLYAAGALCGLALALYNVVLQTLAGVLAGPEARAQSFSNLSLIGSVANFTGPMAAGLLIDYGGGAATASLAMILPSLGAALLLARHGALLPGGSAHAGASRDLLEALRDRALLRTLAVSAMVQLGMELFHFYLPIYGHDQGLSATAIGMVLSAFSLASFIVRLALPLLLARMSEPRLLAIAFLVAATGFALVPLTRDAWTLAAVAFVYGLGIGGGAPLSMMLTFGFSAGGRSGEAMGLRLTANNLVRVIAPTVFGTIGSLFGAVPVFVLGALTLGAGGLLCRGLKAARPAQKPLK